MKFQSAAAFEKHLQHSFPTHLAQVYLFISPCEYEKRLWTNYLLALLKQKEPQLQLTHFEAPPIGPIAVQDELRTPSLWGGLRAIVIDQIDKVKNLEPFLKLLDSLAPDVILIFLAACAKSVSELYQKGKKELVALDVSEEKPWDKEKRLHQWLRDEALKEGKQLPSEVTMGLIKDLGTDLATLYQELKKLLTYVGSKTIIEWKDAEAVCSIKDLSTGWQLAERLVWKSPIPMKDKIHDLGFLFPFLGQLRYHLQLGAQIADVLERKMAVPDLKKHFPSVRNLEKFIPLAAQRKSRFFLRGLLKLYEFELLAKSASLDLRVAFDIFQAHMYEKTPLAS